MKNKKNHQDSQDKKFPNYHEALHDYKKSGKLRDWDGRETLTNALAIACLETPGLEKQGERMLLCGRSLDFEACIIVRHGKKLKRANFCKYRLCPMCQPRKANKVRDEVFALAKAHLEKYSNDVPLLLTLTAPNVNGEDIGREIDDLMKAFERLIKRKAVKRMNRSWFKSLEITKNQERNDFHPHFHILLMVPPEYFYKDSPLYITHDEWLKLWQEAKRDFTITQVDIRAIKGKNKEGKLEALIAEAAKYTTKPSSYIYKDKDGKEVIDREALSYLHDGLKGRRTIGYGGYFKEVRKERKLEALEKAAIDDTENLNEDGTPKEKQPSRCRECNREMIAETYIYNDKLKRYCKVSQHDHGPSP